MRTAQSGYPLRQLRDLFAAGTATGLTDIELLERYTAKRAESAEAATAAEMAFAALVDRHGAMVWGVCQRVLGETHEAEDAFQATFLVLVRKAGSVRVDGSLGRWLYGVAHRVALRARSEARRRASGIDRTPPMSSDDPAADAELGDLRDALGEELDRLPAKYRCPVELCHLQGMTYDQAARQLDWAVATVKSRLTRGRLRLRERLARRGLGPVAVAVGMPTLLAGEARAAVPQELVRSTARAIVACAPGAFPAAVTDLTEGVLKMMMWEKLRLVAVGALVAVGLTAQALSQQAPDGGNPRGAAATDRGATRRKTEREADRRSPLGPEPAQRSDHRGHRDFLLPVRPRYVVASRRDAVTSGALRPDRAEDLGRERRPHAGCRAPGPHPRRGRPRVVRSTRPEAKPRGRPCETANPYPV